MLQKIGDLFTKRKWLTYTLFGALSLIFAAWGAYGIATIQFSTGSDAAKVNGITIPFSQVQQQWLEQQSEWEQRFGGQMPAAVRTSLENQLLDEFIRDALMAQHTRKLGYRVSQSELVQAITSEPAFQLQGKYSPEVAKMRLQQAGISEQGFEADLKQSIRAGQLQGGIRDTEFLTPAEVKRIVALRNEEREIQYVVVPASKFTSQAPIGAKAIETYYEDHKADFMVPEYVHLEYAELDLAKVEAGMKVDDADLHAYYDKHKRQYVLAERRRVRHILIAIDKHRDAAQALQRADRVLAKLKAGASFAALAKQYSDDPGSASKGGDLGWVARSTLSGALASAVFSLKPGQVSDPVKTQFGYHILELEGIEPGKTQTFAQARAAILPIVRRQEATDRLGDIQDQIQQQLDEGTPSLAGLAKTFGMTTGQVAQFDRSTGGAPLGSSRDLQQVVFGDSVLNQHHLGGPVLIDNDRLVLVQVLDHHLPAPKPLAQVRSTITAAIEKRRASDAALAAAQAAVHKLDSGTTFASAVQGLDVKAGPPRFVGRTDPSVPQQIRQAVFASPKPVKGKPATEAIALDSGDAAVFSVTNVKTPATTDPSLEKTTLQQAALAYGTEVASDYLEQLLATAKIQKNLAAFNQ
ncbi:MAG: peptidyl-prolyl cis-trans isomerase [Steroidobacteraceae bacterium]